MRNAAVVKVTKVTVCAEPQCIDVGRCRSLAEVATLTKFTVPSEPRCRVVAADRCGSRDDGIYIVWSPSQRKTARRAHKQLWAQTTLQDHVTGGAVWRGT
jgi:hypothetical protein